MKINGPIVIVDDDEDDHYFFQTICQKIGVTAGSGFFMMGARHISISIRLTRRPLLYFVTLTCRGMGGLELRKLINANERLRKQSIPFIFYSTAASPSQVSKLSI